MAFEDDLSSGGCTMNQHPSHVGSASEKWGTEGYIPQLKVLSAKSSGVVLENMFNVLVKGSGSTIGIL